MIRFHWCCSLTKRKFFVDINMCRSAWIKTISMCESFFFYFFFSCTTHIVLIIVNENNVYCLLYVSVEWESIWLRSICNNSIRCVNFFFEYAFQKRRRNNTFEENNDRTKVCVVLLRLKHLARYSKHILLITKSCRSWEKKCSFLKFVQWK